MAKPHKEEVSPAKAHKHPACFLQADLGFQVRRAGWAPHVKVTSHGKGGYVNQFGKAYVLAEGDLEATDWSVEK